MFQICGSSYLKRGEWKAVYESILHLADNLRKYGTYLQSQNISSQTARARNVLGADVDEWEVYQANIFIESSTKRACYQLLHEALRHSEPYQLIFVNEFAPTDRRRSEYVNELVFPCKTMLLLYPVNNYYGNANICDISKSIETATMKLQQHKLYRFFYICSNFEVQLTSFNHNLTK